MMRRSLTPHLWSAMLPLLVAMPTLRGQASAPAATPPASPDTAAKIVVGGFVDGYFAYDFNRPANLDRAYTTQAARHDEFNVNLAYLDVTLSGPRLRGRFAAQFGTSVQANYASEPRLGTLSGPDVSRFIQEAFVGYQVTPSVWIDGGVFFSPFGSESWISRDNWTYTRSLIAENSPYYEAGVKATWQATPALSAQLHVINGWQDISETNSDKALGLRVDYALSPRVAVAFDGFVGNEMPDTVPPRTRLWQEGIVTVVVSERWQVRGTLDHGIQQHRGGGGEATWNGYAVVVRNQTTSRVALAARVEGYADPEQVIVTTGHPYGLRATGWSLNADVVPQPRLLWRSEIRWLDARDPLFPSRREAGGLATSDPLVVSSLALTF